MAEPSLNLRYEEIAGEVGFFLGYGRGEEMGDRAWTTKQAMAIESCVRSGYRRFLFPPPLPGQAVSYYWSFLRPTLSVTVASGDRSVALPDDYGGLEGSLAVSLTGTANYNEMRIVSEGTISQAFAASPDETGRPRAAAIRALRGTSATKASRQELAFFPQSDGAYTFVGNYYYVPEALTIPKPYAVGGAVHAETLLESCLALAEKRLNNAVEVHAMEFMERLAASIAVDLRSKPATFGYNRDLSDSRGRYGDSRNGQFQVTINGSRF